MIASSKRFCVICDDCHKVFVNDDGEAWFSSEKEAEYEACDAECVGENGEFDVDYNFVYDDDTGKHYCSGCAKKVGLIDDDDEYLK